MMTFLHLKYIMADANFPLIQFSNFYVGSLWMVPEDTIPTNVYTSSYIRHRTVQYKDSDTL